MFNRANIVGILIKAKKHGLVFFDGEIVFAVSRDTFSRYQTNLITNNIYLQSVRAEDDDEFVVLQKPIAEIRSCTK